jgi:hypothetical protein
MHRWGWLGNHRRPNGQNCDVTFRQAPIRSLSDPRWWFSDAIRQIQCRARSQFRTRVRTASVEPWPWSQFRHHAGAECIRVFTCQLHHGLIAQGEHLIRRCQGWTDDMVRQRGWAPEVG